MSTAAQEWYYIKDGNRLGPVTGGQLKQMASAGQIQPGDLLWKNGLQNWVPASSVKGLFGARPGGPPGRAPGGPPAFGFQQQGGYQDRGWDERPAPPGGDEFSQLSSVSLGLGFMGWRYILLFFMFLCGAGILFSLLWVSQVKMLTGPDARLWATIVLVLGLINGLMGLVMLVFIFIGSSMCCRAPGRSGAKVFMIISLTCDTLFVLLTIVGSILVTIALNASPPNRSLANTGNLLGVVGMVFMVIAQIMTHLFLYKMGHFLREPRVPGGAILNMILWLCVPIIGGLITFVLGLILGSTSMNPMTAALVLLITMLAFIVIFAFVNLLLALVIGRLRRRIRAQLDR